MKDEYIYQALISAVPVVILGVMWVYGWVVA